MELARWSTEKGRTSSKPPRPPRKHELEQDQEQEEEQQPNLSEVWSEPDHTVSLARIGLPENKTPVNQTVSSPNSSEFEHSPRTPGKKASYKKLVQRLHATEQIIEALQAELSAHKALAKAEQPVGQEAALESQRARLEVVVRQSEATRQQLEAAARGEAGGRRRRAAAGGGGGPRAAARGRAERAGRRAAPPAACAARDAGGAGHHGGGQGGHARRTGAHEARLPAAGATRARRHQQVSTARASLQAGHAALPAAGAAARGGAPPTATSTLPAGTRCLRRTWA
ncbi:coiled-coil domain-containing protein 96-like isoform X2 [Cloeon dipterum]|uniref:coiled-coil domain-containing protein 96-like isoform X2 n=1 Tax=Cloeon dipterum TaxID=197152 RepID=UPI00322091FC